MKLIQSILFLSGITVLVACSGSSIRVIIESLEADTADYSINSVQIVSSDPQPGAGKLRVRIVYTLHQTGGTVSPIITLFDDDGGFRFGDDQIDRKNFVEGATAKAPGQYDGFMEFELRCRDGKVIGNLGGTGEGYSDVFGINEAEIKAVAQRQGENQIAITSDSINFWCEN